MQEVEREKLREMLEEQEYKKEIAENINKKSLKRFLRIFWLALLCISVGGIMIVFIYIFRLTKFILKYVQF